ncbi:MAG: peroxide stress protein YaaA [Betaproteobacteria bacterium]|nr:peroxide stress protein YaaA [Betaproteobacteria bacterium]
MLMVLSPAKSLDYESSTVTVKASKPRWMDESAKLVAQLRTLEPKALGALMDISQPLAMLNHERYKHWKTKPAALSVRPAIFAFDGDVYDGLRAREFDLDQVAWAQDHVRILSGLYGVLRPLDQLQAYRLEMGTRLANEKGKDLYDFWGSRLAKSLDRDLKGHASKLIVNLASEEYFSAVEPRHLKAKVLQLVFQESKGGPFKVVSFSAKRARGAICRWAIEHRIDRPDAFKDFDRDGYQYCKEASEPLRWVFRRKLDASSNKA